MFSFLVEIPSTGDIFDRWIPANLRAVPLTTMPPKPTFVNNLIFVYSQSRLTGALSGQGAGSGARNCDGRVSPDLRAHSLSTVPPTFIFSMKSLIPTLMFIISE
ncbi:hypothetical protein PoB_001719000 [Plakobranchus ocellatus]|uniref:Uncharacterized protein n=1 Tax=Plakobranchus ocellatus TaxID=259542 RepID=A0AAV3Z7Z3_9GAST|nr:hypothetical protein PoB_001719000 [Plakobranchus ocellatus]